MSQTARGNHQAFAELYDLTVRRVYGTVLRVLRSPEHAEEVTQEVYTELWQQSPRYCADKGSVITWMVTVARRRAVDRVRSVSSEVAREARYAVAAPPEIDDVWTAPRRSRTSSGCVTAFGRCRTRRVKR